MNGQDGIIVRFAGTAGEGVLTVGELLGRVLARLGYHVFYSVDYDAEIRGERLSMSQVRASTNRLTSRGDTPDILVAMSREAAEAHLSDLSPTGLLVYDPKTIDDFGAVSVFEVDAGAGRESLAAPFLELAWKKAKRAESKNMAALGVVSALLGIPRAPVLLAVEERLGKGGHAAEANRMALELGRESVGEGRRPLQPSDGVPRLFLSGNDAVAMGAIAAGCRFFAGYPITPASEIMEWFGRHLAKTRGVVMQMEDEMAAMGAVLGASFGGVKAMTATSGPGLSLMSELINLGAMAEVPAVIVDVQRGGPGTGLPTKPEQSDLNMAVFGVHGESPRIVLAASSVEDCFYRTILAFNLAEHCQTPVVLLSDQFIGQRKETVDGLDPLRIPLEDRLEPEAEELEGYQRYRDTESGVSPMAIPGTKGGMHVATGLEHTQRGLPGYAPHLHRRMTEKRFRKLDLVEEDGFVRSGDDAPVVLIGWGSTAGVIEEAGLCLRDEGVSAEVVEVNRLNPFPKGLRTLMSGRKVFTVEMNFTGQLHALLGLHGIEARVMPWDGRVLAARDVAEWVKMQISGECVV